MIRLSLSLAIVLSCATPTRADPLTNARRLKAAGEVMTWLGVAFEAGGLAMIIAGMEIPSCAFALGAPESGPCSGGAPPNDRKANSGTANGLFVAGAGLAGVATALLAVGIPSWSVGAKREKQLRRVLSLVGGRVEF